MKYRALIFIILLLFLLCPLLAAAEQECEHQYGEWVLTATPTCIAKGEVARSCTLCGDVQTASVVQGAHAEGDWTLCQAPEVGVAGSMQKSCTVCGEVLLTQELAALPDPAPEAETETAEQEDWIEITLPAAIGICMVPNVVLIVVLLVRKIRRMIASKITE